MLHKSPHLLKQFLRVEIITVYTVNSLQGGDSLCHIVSCRHQIDWLSRRPKTDVGCVVQGAGGIDYYWKQDLLDALGGSCPCSYAICAMW